MFGAPAGHAALGLPPGTTAGALRAASLPMPGAWGTMEQLCYAAAGSQHQEPCMIGLPSFYPAQAIAGPHGVFLGAPEPMVMFFPAGHPGTTLHIADHGLRAMGPAAAAHQAQVAHSLMASRAPAAVLAQPLTSGNKNPTTVLAPPAPVQQQMQQMQQRATPAQQIAKQQSLPAARPQQPVVRRAAPAQGDETVPSWVPNMLDAAFFVPCETHKNFKKNECTFFCTTCNTGPHALCQHCMAPHQGHTVIQIRRYVYCDVIRSVDISQFMDVAGVQSYIINQARVAFLNPRPQSKVGKPMSPDTCRTCARHLREGAAYCSVACKVEALRAGDAWAPPALASDDDGEEQEEEDAAAAAAAVGATPRQRASLSQRQLQQHKQAAARRAAAATARGGVLLPGDADHHGSGGSSSSSLSEACACTAGHHAAAPRGQGRAVAGHLEGSGRTSAAQQQHSWQQQGGKAAAAAGASSPFLLASSQQQGQQGQQCYPAGLSGPALALLQVVSSSTSSEEGGDRRDGGKASPDGAVAVVVQQRGGVEGEGAGGEEGEEGLVGQRLSVCGHKRVRKEEGTAPHPFLDSHSSPHAVTTATAMMDASDPPGSTSQPCASHTTPTHTTHGAAGLEHLALCSPHNHHHAPACPSKSSTTTTTAAAFAVSTPLKRAPPPAGALSTSPTDHNHLNHLPQQHLGKRTSGTSGNSEGAHCAAVAAPMDHHHHHHQAAALHAAASMPPPPPSASQQLLTSRSSGSLMLMAGMASRRKQSIPRKAAE